MENFLKYDYIQDYQVRNIYYSRTFFNILKTTTEERTEEVRVGSVDMLLGSVGTNDKLIGNHSSLLVKPLTGN